MLAFMRAFAKTWYAKVLFGVLIIAFGLIFNVRDMIGGIFATQNVVSVGSHSVDAVEFKTVFDRNKKEIETQRNGGQPIPMEEFLKAGVPEQMAEKMATQNALFEWLQNIGLKPSEKLIADQLGQVQEFLNPVTGQFDKKQFQEVLDKNGVSRAKFDQEQRDNFALKHFGAGISGGLRVPRSYAAFQAAFFGETRDASWITVDAKVAGAPPAPTDAQLAGFLRENAERYRHPELRSGSMVAFLPEEVAKTITVDADRVKKLYDFRKDTFAKPETRTWIKVTAPNQQAATAIAQALQKGSDPAAAAKAGGGSVVPNDGRPKSAEPDAIVAQAVFDMKPGETSPPIKGQLGWAVVKLASVTPGSTRTFEEVRPDLEKVVRKEAADAKLSDMVQKFEETRSKGATLEAAADAVGLKVSKIAAMSRDGHTADGKQGPRTVADMFFTTVKGSTSEVTDSGDGSYFAVRVDDVAPTFIPTVDQERTKLVADWTAIEQGKRMQAKASELAARLHKGESLQAVAASAGAKIETATDMSRAGGPKASRMAPLAFGHNLNEAFSTPLPDGTGYVVGKVDAIHPAAVALAAGQAERMRGQVTEAISSDMAQAVYASARKTTKAKVNKDRIAAALGVTETPDAKKSGAKK